MTIYFENTARKPRNLPVSLLLDREGREVARKLGAARWDSTEVVEDLRRRITRPE